MAIPLCTEDKPHMCPIHQMRASLPNESAHCNHHKLSL